MSLILSGTDGLSDVDGSASTPAIRGTDTNTGIFFPATDTIAFAEGGAEIARFNSSGNLGIGITTPNTELHVQGAPTTDGSIVFNEQLTATTAFNASPQSGTMVSLKYNTGGDYAGLGGWSVIKENATDGNFAGATLFHSRPNGGAITERMRINSSGSLLVGITSPMGGGGGDNIRGFQVMSGNSAQMIIQNSSDACQYLAKVSGYSSGIYTNFYIADTQVGKIESNGSSTSYVTSSDYRLKENIAPMTGALAKVSTLKPVTYTWKSTGKASQGFIAHELQEVVPDCVSGEKDATETVDIKDEDGNVIGQETKPVYQGIDTSFLVATLTAAIQEQQAIITDLKSRIEALEAK
jgi:hypothetical protein